MKGGGRKENGVANVLRPAPEYASASILTFFHCVVFPRRRQERNKRHIMKNHSVICHNVVVVKGINQRVEASLGFSSCSFFASLAYGSHGC